MSESVRDLKVLSERAAGLPNRPGVYIMKDKNGKIIYIGKSRVLKQRVSQYFQENAEHDIKTAKMISLVYDFDWMLTDSEIEALTLENRLIKLHLPKFNIKLKDSKSYPYIKVDINEEYPTICVVRKRLADNARYFGPYSSASIAYTILRTIYKTFKIASCKRKFPQDIGKSRPCLYKQLGQCIAPCTGNVTSDEYKESFRQILLFLRGSYSEVKKELLEKMEYAAENLMFEAAALYRDRITSLDTLWQRQKVVSSPDTEQDVVALYQDDLCSCITVMYVRGGSLIDKESFVFHPEQIINGANIGTFLTDLYLKREYIPKEILLDFDLDSDESEGLSEFLSKNAEYKVKLTVPERGDKKALCALARDNAQQYALQYNKENEKNNEVLARLASMLSLEVVPEHIEAYDISNLGGEKIMAGMITVEDAKFKKSGYRVFNIAHDGLPDDYAAMRQAVERRLNNTELAYPDLLLLDGGKGHVSTIKALLEEKGIEIPVFGMVKDDYHKTRALTTESSEISIARDRPVFMFIYKIQEEVHRFTVTRMNASKEKTLRTSVLEKINGIGPAKARELMRHFKSLAKIKTASKEELVTVKRITAANADAIFSYFKANNN